MCAPFTVSQCFFVLDLLKSYVFCGGRRPAVLWGWGVQRLLQEEEEEDAKEHSGASSEEVLAEGPVRLVGLSPKHRPGLLYRGA